MISKNLDPVITYPGDNATALFGIPFPTFEAESLKIFLTLLIDGSEVAVTKDVDYTLKDLNVNGIEASLTLIDSGQAWINGGGLDVQYSITVEFDSQAFQPASFRSWTYSSPKVLEQTLDRLTMSIKAVDTLVKSLDNTQTDANTAAIQVLQAQVIAIQAEIVIVQNDLLAVHAVIDSKDSILTDNNTAIFDTVDSGSHRYAILEYFAVRNGAIQYGREIVQKDELLNTFTLSPIERAGNVGVTFSLTNAGGVGSVRSTTDATGFDGKLNYTLYKYTL